MTQSSHQPSPHPGSTQSPSQTTEPLASNAIQRRAARPRWQIELIWAGSGVAFGMFVLPALVFLAGQLLLGPYGGGTMAEFYGRYFQSLLSGATSAWSLVLGPALIMAAVRHSLRLFPKNVVLNTHLDAPNHPAIDSQPSVAHNQSPATSSNRRREPFVGT